MQSSFRPNTNRAMLAATMPAPAGRRCRPTTTNGAGTVAHAGGEGLRQAPHPWPTERAHHHPQGAGGVHGGSGHQHPAAKEKRHLSTGHGGPRR